MARESQHLYPTEFSFHVAVSNAIQAHIAVLGAAGVIVAVNDSWINYGKENCLKDTNSGVGSNYLDSCDDARLDPSAREAVQGLRDVMVGKLPVFEHTYPCHSPWQKRWFTMRVAPIEGYPNYLVVSHDYLGDEVTDEWRTGVDRVGRGPRFYCDLQAGHVRSTPKFLPSPESMLSKCAWCKSIKVINSDGSESWVAAEPDVNSIAQITHGICPSCRISLMD